jgi:hypothetical protein
MNRVRLQDKGIRIPSIALAMLGAAGLLAGAIPAQAQTFNVLYNFQGPLPKTAHTLTAWCRAPTEICTAPPARVGPPMKAPSTESPHPAVNTTYFGTLTPRPETLMAPAPPPLQC